jgi:hypothetical protein
MQITATPRRAHVLCSLILAVESFAACGLLAPGHVIYDQQGIRIGVETDPTVARSHDTVSNSHPSEVTDRDIVALLRVVQVSGWSGTLVGIVARPTPVPLFTDKELAAISGPLAAVFQKAAPAERVFFSLPKPDVSYSEDRTEGFLFFRGRYLHVVITDHWSVIRADTGGGDPKDIRDTKGLKLWVVGPAHAAMVPDAEEPRWAPFETVHLSLVVKDVLALRNAPSFSSASREPVIAPASGLPALREKSEQNGFSQDDLQLQIRELTISNQELRARLDEQNKRMQILTDELEHLRLELEKSRAKKAPSRKAPDNNRLP